MSDLCIQRNQQLHHLRTQIQLTLCEKDQLDPAAHRMTEALLRKRDAPCGVLFCVFGPRNVRLTAVWDFASERVLFYDSAGQRFRAWSVETTAGKQRPRK